MKIKDVMTTNTASVGIEKSAQKAARKMARERVSSLLVTAEKGGVGIIAERMLGLYTGLTSRPASEVKVKEFGEENAISASPGMRLSRAAKILEELEIRCLPVAEKGGLVGVLSVSDLAAFIDR